MSSRRILLTSLLAAALTASTVGAEPPKPREGPLGMKFVSLPKGTFYMGWDGTKGSAKKTEIKEDFEIAIYTVTQGQWQELMGKNPSYFSRDGGGKDKVKDVKDEDLKQFPVELVSWNNAQEFIKKLNEKEKGKGWTYRLPTEAEWEYACRGGATSEEECSYHFYFEKPTNDLSSKDANFIGVFPDGKAAQGPYLGRTTKVGSYAPNKLGLYDMHGNVWQWCYDLSDPNALARVLRYDLSDPNALARVLRGGGWRSVGVYCRSGVRFGEDGPYQCCGFRLAAVPAAWAEPPKPREGPLGMKFVPLPKGTFYMGWNGDKKGVKTEIKEDFEIAVYTVTQGQWQEIMGNNRSWFSRDSGGKDKVKDVKDEDLKQFPVELVSWNDAQEFIKNLNAKEKGKGWTYRLPTETEWEYACRGGATSEEECSYHFYFGKPTNDLSSKDANFNGDHPYGKAAKGPYLGRTTKVGSYAPNKLGLYDMHGNVWQWCSDLYEPGSLARVLRGGSWGDYGGGCRSADRTMDVPGYWIQNFGFRLAAVPEVGTKQEKGKE